MKEVRAKAAECAIFQLNELESYAAWMKTFRLYNNGEHLFQWWNSRSWTCFTLGQILVNSHNFIPGFLKLGYYNLIFKQVFISLKCLFDLHYLIFGTTTKEKWIEWQIIPIITINLINRWHYHPSNNTETSSFICDDDKSNIDPLQSLYTT